MHSPLVTRSFSCTVTPIVQAREHCRQPLQAEAFLRIRYSRPLEIGTNSAPSGQRYRQKNRSAKNDTIRIPTRIANPTVGIAESMTLPLPETSMPNTPHGLIELSIGSCSTQTKSTSPNRTAYFKTFRIRSAFSGMRLVRLKIFRDTSASSSCIAPNEHRYPQKKRPHSAVTANTISSVTRPGACAENEKLPWTRETTKSRSACSTVRNSPGKRKNAPI